jgi:hypothetical protein
VTVSGTIVDSLTGRPLENAIAFFAGTTVGTNSSAGGEFLLRSGLAGDQDFVISLVGYDRKVMRLQLTPGDSVSLTIPLSPRLIQQEQVEVMAGDAKEWKANLALFRRIFCGWGEYSEQCRLLNPYVVDLHMRGHTLVAGSDSLLRLDNPALGYDMSVVIRKFEWDIDRDEGVWSVYVLFRSLRPESPDQRAQWTERRRSVYQGSQRHFLWALVHRRVFEEGFEIRTGKWSNTRMWTLIGDDAIQLVHDPGTRLLQWKFPGKIRVDYSPQLFAPCFLRLVEHHSLIDSSGVVMTPLAFELGGRWGWERMGRMLPNDYVPSDHP